MWEQVLANRNRLNPGIEVASLDWLTNIQDAKPMELSLIERGKLENMLECAVVDELTKLYDRDTLLALLEKEFIRARRNSKAISLVMLDLDDFKQVNDRFGHQKGDDVLYHIGNIIRESIRGMDIGGRYGGEEFAIILPETDIRSAVGTAERLRKLLKPDLVRMCN
jgi:diguanylate cyclase (GGDEF)-like protein